MHESLLPKKARELYRRSRHKQRIDALATQLIECGYSEASLSRYVREWVYFAAEFEAPDTSLPTGADAPEVAAYVERQHDKPYHRRDVRRALHVFLKHDPLDTLRARRPRPGAWPLYAMHVPPYLDFVRRHRGRRTTHQLEDCLDKFFGWLATRGVDDLAAVAARDVRDFLGAFPGRCRTTIATYASALRGFLRYAHMEGLVAVDLSSAVEIPALYHLSDPPDVVGTDIVERLLAGIDRTTNLGKRDYAMLLLAARYGLRPGDIRDLRFEDVRWRERRLVIVQSKNQRLLELPLSTDVEAALVDYIQHRPACSARAIFVRHVPPIRPFVHKNNLWNIVARAVRVSGVQLGSKQRGMYVLRHALATRMLKSGVAIHTIKDVLGHASVDTTRRYTQVDLDALREAALAEVEVRR
jgi:site-specific recombinase XerD